MGFLVSTDIWGAQGIQSDFKCKAIVFLNKVLRVLSICTARLLSVLQAIASSPSSSRLAKFKPKSPNPILCLFLFSWVLNVSSVATCSSTLWARPVRPRLVFWSSLSAVPFHPWATSTGACFSHWWHSGISSSWGLWSCRVETWYFSSTDISSGPSIFTAKASLQETPQK